MANLFDVLHSLVDAARFHSEQQVLDAHDTINAHQAGQTLEEYRKAQEASSPAALARQDQILAQADEIRKQREAQAAATADQKAAIAAAEQRQRPEPPVAVAGTPASPTAAPDATPTI